MSNGIIDYAERDVTGQLRLRMPNESLFDDDVEISDEVFILKEEDAQKLREPPKLTELRLNRTQVILKISDQATFKCEGIDQYGRNIDPGTVDWTATGGFIDADGLFTAGDHTGQFEVAAKSGDIEATAEVRIKKVADFPPPTSPGKKTVRWSGTVPPQKWMNFYTKVLSKLASDPDLTLKVTFEVPAEYEQAESKADETRTGLKELGLDDDVQLG